MAGSVASPIITVQMKCEMKALQQYIKKRLAVAETANQHRTCYSLSTAETASKMSKICVRWEENGSAKYDGVTQDISRKFITEKNIAVGDKVTIKWGRRARVWKVMVVDLLDDDDDGEYIDTGLVLTHSTCMCII